MFTNLFEQQAKQLAEVHKLTQPVREEKSGNVVVLIRNQKPKAFEDDDYTPPTAA